MPIRERVAYAPCARAIWIAKPRRFWPIAASTTIANEHQGGSIYAINAEQLRRDIAAYRRIPPTASETPIALLADASGLADEIDWEALYPEVDNNQ